MKLYLTTIGIAMLIIAAVNLAIGSAPWYYILIAVVWCTALQFAIDGSLAFLINKLPFTAMNLLLQKTPVSQRASQRRLLILSKHPGCV